MGMVQEVDDYIKESIDYVLGLPVSEQTLTLKLQASEESRKRLRDCHSVLVARLEDKDEALERARAEANMNAQALKKFVVENQKLATECSNLLSQCSKWEEECALYDRDREALMDFGNEADQRAKEAEMRVLELEEEVRKLSEEVQFYKHESSQEMDESSELGAITEQTLLESVLTFIIQHHEVEPDTTGFLESRRGLGSCEKLLEMWNCLRPLTKCVLSLAAEVETLRKDKEHLRINLNKAEGEVNVLSDELNGLYEEQIMLRQFYKERSNPGFSGKISSSASAKRNKRNSSFKMTSPDERKLEFNDLDSSRRALSPLQLNSINDLHSDA